MITDITILRQLLIVAFAGAELETSAPKRSPLEYKNIPIGHHGPSEFPFANHIQHNLNAELNSTSFGLYSSSNSEMEWSASSTKHLRRTKRAPHQRFYDKSCEQIQKWRDYGIVEPDQNIQDPVTYLRFKRMASVKVIIQLHANLTAGILDTDSCRNNPATFGPDSDKRMKVLGNKSTDVKGHILSSKLCGPPVYYNLFPQSPQLDWYVGGFCNWKELHDCLADHLRSGGQAMVKIFLNYGSIGRSVRPKGLKYCVTLFAANSETEVVHQDGFYIENGEPNQANDDSGSQW